MNNSPWSVPVAVPDIPDAGLHMEIEAPPEARAQLAALANVREVPRLSAVFDLKRRGASVHVAGQISALVGQTCVVTLEPMESSLHEGVDVLFAPPTAGATAADGEIEVPAFAGADEPPEPLVDGKVDLGAIATEFLILGVDPYPRKPGAEFAARKADEPGAHPFAALEALKKRPDGGQT
jgi:Large ribosomal RNA subunit accumulation protein YceD